MKSQAFSQKLSYGVGGEVDLGDCIFLNKASQVILLIQVWAPQNPNIWDKLHIYMIAQVGGHLISMRSREE